jgi:hypothetical protein
MQTIFIPQFNNASHRACKTSSLTLPKERPASQLPNDPSAPVTAVHGSEKFSNQQSLFINRQSHTSWRKQVLADGRKIEN